MSMHICEYIYISLLVTNKFFGKANVFIGNILLQINQSLLASVLTQVCKIPRHCSQCTVGKRKFRTFRTQTQDCVFCRWTEQDKDIGAY